MTKLILILLVLGNVFIGSAWAVGSSSGHILSGYLSAFGINYGLMASSDELAENGRSKLSLGQSVGLEVGRDLGVGPPFFTLHGYGKLTFGEGTAQYKLKTDASDEPTVGADVKLRAVAFETGYGFRYRPLASAFISPIAGVGAYVGAMQLYYNDSDIETKVNGGSYSRYNYTFFYGYYMEVGLDIQPFIPVGIEILARRRSTRTWKVATIAESFLDYTVYDFSALVIFTF